MNIIFFNFRSNSSRVNNCIKHNRVLHTVILRSLHISIHDGEFYAQVESNDIGTMQNHNPHESA